MSTATRHDANWFLLEWLPRHEAALLAKYQAADLGLTIDELRQEIALRVLSRPTLTFEKPFGLLKTLVKNIVIDKRRRKGSLSVGYDFEDQEDPTESLVNRFLDEESAREALKVIVRRHPGRDAVLMLRLVDHHFSYCSTAEKDLKQKGVNKPSNREIDKLAHSYRRRMSRYIGELRKDEELLRRLGGGSAILLFLLITRRASAACGGLSRLAAVTEGLRAKVVPESTSIATCSAVVVGCALAGVWFWPSSRSAPTPSLPSRGAVSALSLAKPDGRSSLALLAVKTDSRANIHLITFFNPTSAAIRTSGWRLRDGAGNTVALADRLVDVGETVTVELKAAPLILAKDDVRLSVLDPDDREVDWAAFKIVEDIDGKEVRLRSASSFAQGGGTSGGEPDESEGSISFANSFAGDIGI